MLWAVLVLALGAEPAPVEVGSVEGAFAWVDVHAGLGSLRILMPPSESLVAGRDRSAATGAFQLQAFAGYGLPLLGHHLALSASLEGTLVPAPLELTERPRWAAACRGGWRRRRGGSWSSGG